LQVAAAALGGGLVPGGIGFVARYAGLEVLGPFLFVAAILTLVLYGAVNARSRLRPPPSP
jgi:hypothetical protein